MGVIAAVLTGTPSHVSPPSTTTASVSSPLWQTLLIGGFIAFIYLGLARDLWQGKARAKWHFFRKITVWSLLSNIPIALIVVVVARFLSRFDLLNRSWMYHLSSNSGNLNTISLKLPIIGIFMWVLLIANLPALAHIEEDVFRKGTLNWSDALIRSVAFGLFHCLVGVTIAVGLALSVGGLWFSFQYFRGGVERSTTYHLSYNLLLLVVFALLTLFMR